MPTHSGTSLERASSVELPAASGSARATASSITPADMSRDAVGGTPGVGTAPCPEDCRRAKMPTTHGSRTEPVRVRPAAAGCMGSRRLAGRECAMATVTFDHVTKKYGDVTAVNDLNLEIQDGEFMVLVGPSGCGKTTSLRMIAGLEEITAGTLRIGDRVVNDVAPKDRDIAMVFQSYALYPHMTVYDNLAFGLKLRKVPKAEIDKRVNEAAGDPRPRQAPRPQAEGAVGRPAPARRARAGDRPRAGGVPDGRAAVEPRRQAPRPDPGRDRPAPPAAQDDHRLRHPRPGRGDDDGHPDRGHERRPAPAGRHARSRSTTRRSTGSSPASSAARR